MVNIILLITRVSTQRERVEGGQLSPIMELLPCDLPLQCPEQCWSPLRNTASATTMDCIQW